MVLVPGCLLPKADDSGPRPTSTYSYLVGSGRLCVPHRLRSPDVRVVSGDCVSPACMRAGAQMPVLVAVNEKWEACLTGCPGPC